MVTSLFASQEVTDLYRADVPVTTQAETERVHAFGTALSEVLTKISGRPSQAMPNPETMVDRYHYDARVNGLFLVVEFDPSAIQQSLKERNLPIWNANRPSTLVWLLVQGEGGSIQLSGMESPSAEQPYLQAEAVRRGVPLTWPILDLLEPSRLPEKGGDKSAWMASLREASVNYSVEATWIGTILPVIGTGGQRTVEWTLFQGPKEEKWETKGPTVPEALAAGVASLVGKLSARIPASSTETSTVIVPKVRVPTRPLVISGTTSFEIYLQIHKYLESLPEVAHVWISHLAPEGRATFTVEPKNNTADLQGAFMKGGRLSPAQNSLDLSAFGDTTLYYQIANVSPARTAP
ncbi:putative DUF2066 domain-containing protein [Gammaproteobacteria bacterium]